MSEVGYNYDSPLDAIYSFVEEIEPTKKQVMTARADIGCKLETNLVGRALAIQSAYDMLYIKEHRQELDQFTSQFDLGE